MLDVLSEKLLIALRNTTLSTDDQIRVAELIKMLESYKLYVSNLMKNKEHIFGNKITDNTKTRTVSYSNDRVRKESWIDNNSKQVLNPVKNKDEGNWRTLKPDSTPKTTIFMRNNSTQLKKPWYGNQDNL